MARFHVHIAVTDLQRNIDFYSTLLGRAPTKVEPDYAKWQMEDPRINFAISTRGQAPGLNHLGLQADSADELDEVAMRLAEAGIQSSVESDAACCYARSDKHWVVDPQGIPWESFHTLGRVPTFDGSAAGSERQSSCCVPTLS